MNKFKFTLLLLCIGYFIDFYDLTIFSVSYNEIIVSLFNIKDINQIQSLFLMFTNFHTAGIIAGGIFFGVLGDKFGRAGMIKYSILIYSIAIIGGCYTHSLALFAFLRFLTGFGLATEYATSSVLIAELFAYNASNIAVGLLYLSGIFGGITATFLSGISWKIMFICGGIGGLVLYAMRGNLNESPLFQNIANTPKGNLVYLLNNSNNLWKMFSLAVLILPFYFVVSVMLIMPRFMNLQMALSESIYKLLLGFFVGNILSTLIAVVFVKIVKDFRPYLFGNTLLFVILLLFARFIGYQQFTIYSLLIGCIGGGLPTLWIQIVAKNYGTNQRNTATNVIYIIGRASMIAFNIGISYFMNIESSFWSFVGWSTGLIALFNIIVILRSRNVYATDMDYVV